MSRMNLINFTTVASMLTCYNLVELECNQLATLEPQVQYAGHIDGVSRVDLWDSSAARVDWSKLKRTHEVGGLLSTEHG